MVECGLMKAEMQHQGRCDLCTVDVYRAGRLSRMQEAVYNSKLALVSYVYCVHLCVFPYAYAHTHSGLRRHYLILEPI